MRPSASLVPLMRPDLMARNTVDLLMPHASAAAAREYAMHEQCRAAVNKSFHGPD
jgi:hypothetical protein